MQITHNGLDYAEETTAVFVPYGYEPDYGEIDQLGNTIIYLTDLSTFKISYKLADTSYAYGGCI